jgi:hypothetical protein
MVTPFYACVTSIAETRSLLPPPTEMTELTMAVDRAQVEDWLHLIRGELEERANLQLTQSQIEELWGLDATSPRLSSAR